MAASKCSSAACQHQRGFTLLEVLVALAIFAITAAAMISGIAGSLSAQSYLERKTIAHWVALNQLNFTNMRAVWPAVGISDGREEMAGHEWHWTRKVEGTADPKLRRVEIEVRAEREDEDPLVRIAGFVTDRPADMAAPSNELEGGGYSDGTEKEPDDPGTEEPPPEGPPPLPGEDPEK